MRAAAALSTAADPLAGAVEAARAAAEQLGGEPADLAVAFAAGAHLTAPEATLEGIDEALAPGVLIGCGAGGVLAEGRELEAGTAVAVWAASLHGGSARSFHATVTEVPEGAVMTGVPQPDVDGAVIVLSDPYSFATDGMLEALAREAPGVPVLGGLASARTTAGAGALFLDGQAIEGGAVGVCLDGVEMLPCVSQGAAPLGREMTITAAEDNVILELAGKPAITTIEEVVAALPPPERSLVAAGLLIGIVIDGGKPEYEQGDFLVRGVLGADSDTGAIAVGAAVSPGQVVRLHARDSRSADLDLRQALDLRRAAAGPEPPAGALVFSCNGRGQSMFGACDHDATVVREALQGAPAAGFFAAGEIGPVGARSFLHTFTSTVAVFPR